MEKFNVLCTQHLFLNTFHRKTTYNDVWGDIFYNRVGKL